MATNIEGFFTRSDAIYPITEGDDQKIDLLVHAVKVFARSTHQCVYVIDFLKQNFLYVSENFVYWCGQTSDTIKHFGYKFYWEYMPEKEQQMLLEANEKGIDLFNKIPLMERLDYIIQYDFHMIQGKKRRLLNHCLTPMLLTKDGHIWLALCTISMSARKAPGYIIMKKSGSKFYYEYAWDKHGWIEKEEIALREMERDILILSAQGYTMHDIANKLCKSVDTVKSCKKVLFSKMGVRNIAEALSYATNYKLL